MAISLVGASVIWRFMYAFQPKGRPQTGLLNAVVVALGGEPVVDGVRFTNVPSYLHADRLLMRPRGVRLFGAAAERKGLSVSLAHTGVTGIRNSPNASKT